ncbi:glycosyl transferase [Microbacterium testaceum]|uniref:Glycosyl transferase n=1 Tax=Microbacterium testaceum TaxID=2033 RepID=A0A4Y3QIN9_MICTE|nr:glycosyltransferase family 39 protein [Microbacterium testaceum]GEB44769.1 glycosyl transferase [Microbacterium testaceum]
MTAASPHLPAPTLPLASTLRRPRRWTVGLLAIGLVSLVLTGWQIWAGAPSEYYASIALSMSRSWSNFFFGAVDPAGTVTLDKIPGSFWIPALFVRAFGYSAWAVILPNALAAVAAALVTAVTARRVAGERAGLIAGAVVAVTPILVAVARSNQPETFFVLGLSLTAWAAVRAVQARSLGWLTAAGALIGLSFQFYELEAWAVWPALAAAYLFTRQSWGRRIGHLALAGLVSLAASLWWVAIVSLIPAGSRPYIGSTIANNPWEMVFGYNGLGRFSATADSGAYESFTPPFSGEPGVLRLFNAQLAGQVAWLIPAAVVGLIVLWVLRFSRPLTVLLTVWLVTFAAMFSAVAGMHQFYTASLAVPLALAVGAALAAAHRAGKVWPQMAIVGAAGATALGIGFSTGGYSVPVSIAQALAAVIAIVLLSTRHRGRPVATVALMVGLLLTPAVWSAVTVAHPNSINPVAGGVSESSGFGGRGFGGGEFAGGMPTGGRGSQGVGAAPGGAGTPGQVFGQGSGRGGAPGGSTSGHTRGGSGGAPTGGAGFGAGGGEDNAALLSWLQARSAGSTYLAATFGAQSAAQLIIASNGGSFLPIGGFNGTDDVPTLQAFTAMVDSGQVRYVIGGDQRGGGTSMAAAATTTASSQIRTWVTQHCATDASAPATVYDCG